jgi:hypothetical protein
MQTYDVEFTPASLSPLRITDALRVETRPAPHVAVGDTEAGGKGVRIPLTTRLAGSLNRESPMVGRAKAYRDPQTRQIVLGIEQDEDSQDTRAIVLLSASSGFPEGLAMTPQKGLAVLARGEVGRAQQLLLIWPDGIGVEVEDPVREQRYELRRSGDQFDRRAL